MFDEHTSLLDYLCDFTTGMEYPSLLNDNNLFIESPFDSTLTVSLTPFGHVAREC